MTHMYDGQRELEYTCVCCHADTYPRRLHGGYRKGSGRKAHPFKGGMDSPAARQGGVLKLFAFCPGLYA